jgi:MFS family permease
MTHYPSRTHLRSFRERDYHFLPRSLERPRTTMNQGNSSPPQRLAGASPFAFVMMMGLVNLFADMTYEGAASINGPFLGSLGGSAAAIGIVAGLGEFLGYAVRLPAGYLGDKTGKTWLLTFIGYAINLLAVPALALAGNWPLAAALVVMERVGRAIRKPTVESMLSYTTGRLGKGWVYGLNTALDEIGAMLGPLLIALVLLLKGEDSFRAGYATLLISTLLALAALTIAQRTFPRPAQLESGRTATAKGLTKSYWLYMLAGAFLAAGLMSFELISYHLSTTRVVEQHWIPVFLALSSGFGVIASLVFGKMFDRVGLPVVLVAVLLSSLFSPLVFWGGFLAVLCGLLLWGIGYATQDTLLKAIVAGLLPEGKRNLAFGIFYAGYGSGWLVGSATTGLLYRRSLTAVIVFSISAQLVALPLFVLAKRASGKSEK